jgi:hypothetical protein
MHDAALIFFGFLLAFVGIYAGIRIEQSRKR